MTRVVTYNDQFTDRVTDIPTLVLTHDVGLFQEVKNTRVRQVVGHERFHRLQGFDDGREGVAIVWRKTLGLELDANYELLLRAQRGVKMEPRWIIWVDLLHWDGSIIRYASTHRPPYRFRFRCPYYDIALREWIEDSPYPVVVGMDANRRLGPRRMPNTVKWHHKGIDGAVVSKSLRVSRVERMEWMRSDHRAVSFNVEVGK